MKLLLFDFGGIMESNTIGYTLYDAINSLFKKISDKNLSYDESIDIWKECSVDTNGIYFTEINSEEELEKWFKRIDKEINCNCNFMNFKKIYVEELSKITIFNDVVNLAMSYKNSFKIGILSNISMLDKERMNKSILLEKWDYVFLSFELGCRKPNKKIFEIVLSETGFNTADILFIDDREDNIKTARELGFNVLKTTGDNIDLIKDTIESFK